MYNISEAAKETGLSKHTLRYYEKIELLAITKDEKGHRIYKQADLGALTFIKCLTKTGMALDQIKEMSRLALVKPCLLYTSPSPRDLSTSRMPSSA